MNFFKAFIILFVIGCKNSDNKNDENKTTPYNRFVESVENKLKIMEDSSDNFSIKSAVEIVKIHNSIGIYNFDTKDTSLFNKYEIVFYKRPFQRILNVLEMELSIGMSYYSPKFKISMGANELMKESYIEIK